MCLCVIRVCFSCFDFTRVSCSCLSCYWFKLLPYFLLRVINTVRDIGIISRVYRVICISFNDVSIVL